MNSDACKFFDALARCLEQATVGASCRFREVEGWSSLRAFSILVTLEQDFGRAMRIDEFQRYETVGELAAACGIALETEGEEREKQ